MLAIDGGAPVRTRPFPSGSGLPEVGEEEAQAVAAVVRSGRLWRYDGREVLNLEAEFAAIHGVPARQVVASTSGTAAVHVAVGALDPEPGDEIIVPPITDMGTVIPVLAQNAIPVFADVHPDTYCLDPADVERRISPRTRAIIAVHLFGQPCDLPALRQIADRHGIALIEDAAQAPLADIAGRLCGTWGDFGCFSLQQSKHISSGDGGLTVVADPERAGRARLFMDKGWPREGTERTHLLLGMNYRLTELQAAVARPQLRRLAEIVERRRQVATVLDQALEGMAGLTVPHPPHGGRSAYWLYPVVVEGGAERFAATVRAEGIPLRAGYVQPLYLLPSLRDRRTYGGSGFPFTAPGARPQPEFSPGLCPHAEALPDRLCLLNMRGITAEDAVDAGTAIAKVARALAGA